MSDRVFYNNSAPHKLSKIAEIVGCNIDKANADMLIYNIKALDDADSQSLTFLSNMKYAPKLKNSNALACLVPMDFKHDADSKIVFLKVKNPYYSYSVILDMFYSPSKSYSARVAKTAYISPSAIIGENCYIGHNVVIEDDVEIGDNCTIEANSFIDCKVKIGNRARIDSNVSISHAIIGDDFIALPGARIGQDGFGFSTKDGVHKKIYHIGRVVIGNNVEIGANSTIDRGSMHDTILEDLCRVDNLVQIGHNAHIKRGAILVAQVGIAGSSEIGSYCALGGQVGVAGHVKITDGVQIAGQGGVIQDINTPGIMGGTPAVPIRDWHKQTIMMKRLIKGKL